MSLSPALKKKLLPAVLVVAVAAAAWWSWSNLRSDGLDDAFVSGNGRLEATEVDVATRLAGRVVERHSRHLGQRDDVVQQCDQAGAQVASPSGR